MLVLRPRLLGEACPQYIQILLEWIAERNLGADKKYEPLIIVQDSELTVSGVGRRGGLTKRGRPFFGLRG